MISRADLDAEAAFIRRLIELNNPTGGKHTPTPWKGETVASGRGITDAQGQIIAMFKRPEDRDLALYFTNVHPGMISMLRQDANAFEFIARSSDVGEEMKHFATHMAEQARVYADLFCRLGKLEEEKANGT